MVNFDLELAERVLRRTRGFCEAEPGVGEIVEGGFAEIYYGSKPSSDVMVSIRASSATVPDPWWSGWEAFDEGFTPPTPIVCRNADELAAALVPAYDGWETWAHGRR